MSTEFDDLKMPAINPGGKSAAIVETGLSPKEFEKLVAEAFALVPEKFSTKVSNVGLLIEDEPSDEVLRENNVPKGHTLYGLYRGVPLTARGDSYGAGATLPDTITVFRMPILEAAAHEAGVEVEWGAPTEPMRRRIRAIVRDVIWHEIAHHFGMDELSVGEREEAGTNEFK